MLSPAPVAMQNVGSQRAQQDGQILAVDVQPVAGRFLRRDGIG